MKGIVGKMRDEFYVKKGHLPSDLVNKINKLSRLDREEESEKRKINGLNEKWKETLAVAEAKAEANMSYYREECENVINIIDFFNKHGILDELPDSFSPGLRVPDRLYDEYKSVIDGEKIGRVIPLPIHAKNCKEEKDDYEQKVNRLGRIIIKCVARDILGYPQKDWDTAASDIIRKLTNEITDPFYAALEEKAGYIACRLDNSIAWANDHIETYRKEVGRFETKISKCMENEEEMENTIGQDR